MQVNQAERLAMQVEAVMKKSLEFEELIGVAKADAQEARDQADRRTTELSAENTELSVAIDGIQNDITALRDQLARSQERNAQLASANRDLKASLQIAEDDASTKAEQSQALDDALQVRPVPVLRAPLPSVLLPFICLHACMARTSRQVFRWLAP